MAQRAHNSEQYASKSIAREDARVAALRTRRIAGFVLCLAALLLYLTTLDNGLMPSELEGGDLITHQYAQVQARPSNAPGYPLYTMGGWLWFHLLRPLVASLQSDAPNPLPLLSSYSTLWALLALGLLYAILNYVTVSERHPAGNWPIAWLLSAFYAVTYFFWYYATTTEQYSSAIAQTLAILYVYLLWSDAAAAPDRKRSALRLLFLLAFLCGLSLAHMLTIAFIVPPLVVVILWQQPDLLRNPRAIAGSVIAAALPLLGYIYVYVRGAAHPEWWGAGEWESANEWFWSFVSTAQGREELGWAFEAGTTFFANGFPELMWQELSIPFFVLGILGILLLDRKLAVLLYGFSLLTLVFSWAYRYGNWYQVILPVYPLLLIGVAAIFDRSEARLRARSDAWARYAGALPLLLLAAAVVWRIDASLPAADSRNRMADTGLDRAAVLLDQPLPADARLFATVEDALALQYLTEIWGLGHGARSVSSSEAGHALAAGAPLLATWPAAPTLAQELPKAIRYGRQTVSPDWVAFELESTAAGVAAPAIGLDEAIVAGVKLLGVDVELAPTGAPVADALPGLDVTLFWDVPASGWPEGLNISVRPTVAGAFIPDPQNPSAIMQQDRGEPALGLDESSPRRDPYRFAAADTAEGLLILLYRTVDGGFENVAEVPVDLTGMTDVLEN